MRNTTRLERQSWQARFAGESWAPEASPTLQTADLLRGGFTVTAVGSRSQASADAFAAEFGIGTAHGSYEALVADPDVDVVYVSTPHPFHAGERAARAGRRQARARREAVHA